MLTALQANMEEANQIVLEEENLETHISSELNTAGLALIAWAVIITLAIVMLVAVIFRRLRKARRHSPKSDWPSAASVISDAESGPPSDTASDRASVIDLETSDTHHEIDVENTNGLYDDDSAFRPSSTSDTQPKFKNALTRSDVHHGSLKSRGLFFPSTSNY
jgi:hypothetical protein